MVGEKVLQIFLIYPIVISVIRLTNHSIPQIITDKTVIHLNNNTDNNSIIDIAHNYNNNNNTDNNGDRDCS